MKNKLIISVCWIGLIGLIACKASKEAASVPKYNQFEKLTITEITPKGWINEFLTRQGNGLGGNIQVAGYPFSTCLWACEKMEGSTKAWWPYEQTAYYLDGVQRLGLLLGNEELIGKARENTSYVLSHIDSSGRFGTNLADRWWRWPYASFNRVLMVQQEVEQDAGIVKALTRHYRTFEADAFSDDLELANVEQLCWLYEKTSDSLFLKMAEEAYTYFKADSNFRNRRGQNGPSDMVFGSERVPDHHGVVYMELAKIPSLLYKYTGKDSYLKEAENAIAKMEKHHGLAGGIPSTTEHFEPTSETAGYEVCNTAVLPYTYGHLLRVNGDASLGDRIEKAVFNGAIGAITKDFKAHQYFSAPNQAIADATSNPFGHKPTRMAFMPGHDVECCTGNVNRFMPYYVEQMWLKTKDNGLVANTFGPSSVKTSVGKSKKVVEVEALTDYPFSEKIDFKFSTKEAIRFPFLIRIPSWCKQPEIYVNAKKVEGTVKSGSYFKLDRKFVEGDIVSLHIPMEIEQKQWAGKGISIERGPLTFSLPIQDKRSQYGLENKHTESFPGWELQPSSDWNYTLANMDFEVIKEEVTAYPWEENNSPIRIKAKMQKVNNWRLNTFFDDHFGIQTTRTPAFPDKLELDPGIEEIELVPYGNTLLRITIFPYPNKN